MIDVGMFRPMAGKRSSPRQIARGERRALIVQRSYALESDLAERVARAREMTGERREKPEPEVGEGRMLQWRVKP